MTSLHIDATPEYAALRLRRIGQYLFWQLLLADHSDDECNCSPVDQERVFAVEDALNIIRKVENKETI